MPSARAADCVVIITDHRVFDYDAIVKHAQLIVDTRNSIKEPHPNVFKLGAPTKNEVRHAGRLRATN
jgi:UDP-N-acetyl-D-glucosamine dehydrogenase